MLDRLQVYDAVVYAIAAVDVMDVMEALLVNAWELLVEAVLVEV